jgi:hypothetical protein
MTTTLFKEIPDEEIKKIDAVVVGLSKLII